MSPAGQNPSGPGDVPRIMRYVELEERARKRTQQQVDQVDQLRAAVKLAQQRYSDALRAFPADYYEHAGHPGAASPPRAAAEPAPKATDELLDHNYDGIQEYDNPTPGWWHAIFAGSIVFSVLYILVYHSIVPPLPERHARAKEAALEKQFAELNKLPMGEEKILAIMNEPNWLDQGQAIFQGTCSVCHGADGAGLIGPNLTDDKYKNIASLMDIPELIVNGTDNGAMPAQRNLLSENEIALVAAYAASLRGQDLPTNPIVDPAYTGEPIDPWPEPADQ